MKISSNILLSSIFLLIIKFIFTSPSFSRILRDKKQFIDARENQSIECTKLINQQFENIYTFGNRKFDHLYTLCMRTIDPRWLNEFKRQRHTYINQSAVPKSRDIQNRHKNHSYSYIELKQLGLLIEIPPGPFQSKYATYRNGTPYKEIILNEGWRRVFVVEKRIAYDKKTEERSKWYPSSGKETYIYANCLEKKIAWFYPYGSNIEGVLKPNGKLKIGRKHDDIGKVWKKMCKAKSLLTNKIN